MQEDSAFPSSPFNVGFSGTKRERASGCVYKIEGEDGRGSMEQLMEKRNLETAEGRSGLSCKESIAVATAFSRFHDEISYQYFFLGVKQ